MKNRSLLVLLVAMLCATSLLAGTGAAHAAGVQPGQRAYWASQAPTKSGWGVSRSRDGYGYTRKWKYLGNSKFDAMSWRIDGHEVYIVPYPTRGWSWTWCHCNGGTWSVARTQDLVIYL